MHRTILVPLDGSDFAQEALPLAALLADREGAELHLVHVIRSTPDVDFKMPQDDLSWRSRARDGAEGYLTEIAEGLREEGISTLITVLEGSVTEALAGYVRDQQVDLIVLTSHGHGGVRRWWLGSVADGLLRTSRADVLLVRPWDDTEDRDPGTSRFDRILVPLDGSELAESALPPALDLATRFDATVTAVRVIPEPLELTSIYGVPGVELSGEGHRDRTSEAEAYLKELTSRPDFSAVETRTIEDSGAADGVVEAAKELDSDLIVLSSRGIGGLERLVLGSVADKVVRSTTRPVLVIRPAATRD
jgi:nucleotide-binding universal stress UspA family protein